MIIIMLSSCFLHAQSDSLDVYLERLIEAYVENNDVEGFDYSASMEYLEDLRKHPYDINKVSESDLSNFFFLSPIQKRAILNHRLENGDYLTLEELQTVDELDDTGIRILKNYLTIEPVPANQFSLSDIGENGHHTLFLKYKRVLQQKRGYSPENTSSSKYFGNANHFFARYKFESNNNFRAGFTAEKDPGEQFFTGSNKKGFDFYSAYIYVQNVNRFIKSINVGDYAVSLGQGLILHNDFGSGKSAYVMDIKKSGKTFKPYSSVNESNFFRGIAATLTPIKNTELSLFYSRKNIDATVITDTTELDRFEGVSSIIRTGYHRTQSEIDKKNALTQTNFGGKFEYKGKGFSIGLHNLTYHFSRQYTKTEVLYNKYVFNGTMLSNTGVDYTFYHRNLTFFGEIARSNNGGLAQIHSLLIGLDKKIDASFSYRNFDADYQVLEANAFSEANLPINEKAFYFGVEIRPNNAWKISSYVDMWHSPWLKYKVAAPSNGREALVRLEYNIKRKFNAYIQYRYEGKPTTTSLGIAKVDYTIPTHQNRLRLHMAQKVTKEIELRSRAEFSWYSKEGRLTKGNVVYQDIIYKPIAKPYSMNLRFALFDTEDFNSRIYAYENDILYEYAIPFYANRGKRFYTNFRYQVVHGLTAEMRYAITHYDDLSTISQGGSEEIKGSIKSDIKAQLRLSF
jgi:hypothetical protein